MTVQVFVNGQTREMPEGTSITSLLADLRLAAQQVAVEVNLELVPRQNHAERYLRDGDQLEVVTLVGGG